VTAGKIVSSQARHTRCQSAGFAKQIRMALAGKTFSEKKNSQLEMKRVNVWW